MGEGEGKRGSETGRMREGRVADQLMSSVAIACLPCLSVLSDVCPVSWRAVK